ncbi:MAG TPA: fibrobacter succinogenes major paralogous domain-containing protein [Chitinivibrionales bacterium]|nr:fibrobacter succinogenes major paralogous domain-containing protein [Chitinivibrionales bacterium]
MTTIKYLLAGSVAAIILSTIACTKTSTGPDTGGTTVKDIDGNIYTAVKIGNQVWTAENLRTTAYNDGTPIPHAPLLSTWATLSTPAYASYNNTTDADSIKKFGLLYNWYTVGTGRLAPAGWHVPTSAEWDTLRNYLVAHGYNWDGSDTGNGIGKSLAAKTDWNAATDSGDVGWNTAANDGSGFSGLPAGIRFYDVDFKSIGQMGYWWTATAEDVAHSDYRMLSSSHDYLDSYLILDNTGLSVRLVKD